MQPTWTISPDFTYLTCPWRPPMCVSRPACNPSSATCSGIELIWSFDYFGLHWQACSFACVSAFNHVGALNCTSLVVQIFKSTCLVDTSKWRIMCPQSADSIKMRCECLRHCEHISINCILHNAIPRANVLKSFQTSRCSHSVMRKP